LNHNIALNRLDNGTTGFFRNVVPSKIGGLITVHRKVGIEFHGIIEGGEVVTTEGRY